MSREIILKPGESMSADRYIGLYTLAQDLKSPGNIDGLTKDDIKTSNSNGHKPPEDKPLERIELARAKQRGNMPELVIYKLK